MVLSWKRVECLLRVGSEVLSQADELKYLRVLFTSDGRIERDIDSWIRAMSAVVQTLYWSVVVKRELSQKARLSVYWPIFVPTLICGHKLWVMTKRMSSRIQSG